MLFRSDRRLGKNVPVGVGEVGVFRHGAGAVLGDHGQRALREIAEIVGEIGVDAVDDRLVRSALHALQHLIEVPGPQALPGRQLPSTSPRKTPINSRSLAEAEKSCEMAFRVVKFLETDVLEVPLWSTALLPVPDKSFESIKVQAGCVLVLLPK